MRAGVCSVQQALTVEAASVVKQAVSLARRRGHAQVTPLHVASTMLASPTGLLRRACLQSHSHPLQCKALELCFNVSLNRLPASTASALLGPHSSYPSLSNALVAAFKRAQAHQRRESVENQQQPILALKIEIEQLVISILDDPSVSRVMKEAGFSSPQVKNKVEQAVPMESCSQSSITLSSKAKDQSIKPQALSATVSQFLPLTLKKPLDPSCNDDAKSVLNSLVTKKRNTVITGESIDTAESIVRGVTHKFEKGDVPEDFRSVRFISLPLFSFRSLPKEEVEQKLTYLRCMVKSYMSNGVILYLGDLKWIADFWATYGEQRRSYYCSVEQTIMELKRLVSVYREAGRLWLMGIATFQTYMKCKAGHPSLETIWELCPVTVPVGSLSLSLNFDSTFSDSASMYGSSRSLIEPGGDHSSCCIDFSTNFNREAHSIEAGSHQNRKDSITISRNSSLPLWLQQYKEDTRTNNTDEMECINAGDLCRKGTFGTLFHQQDDCCYPEKTIRIASYPSSPVSISSNENDTIVYETHPRWPDIFEPKELANKDRFWLSECGNEVYKSNFRNDPKPDLLSNPNSSPNSTSSSEAMDDLEGFPSLKELNESNLKILCSGLKKNVPWQKGIIPEIAATILKCRSGMCRRKRKRSQSHMENREETWLFFLGVDLEGKEKIAKELARLVFGSQTNFVPIGLSHFSSPRADSTEESNKNKRARNEAEWSYLERFGLALNENPHRVFFMEDVEQADYSSQKGIKQAIENGRVTLSCGENVPLKDAIVIFSSESFSSMSRASSPSRRLKLIDHGENNKDDDGMKRRSTVVKLDLNIAIECENGDESSVSEKGILEYVDKQIIFRIL